MGLRRPDQPHARRRAPRQDRPRPPLRRRAADQGRLPRAGGVAAERLGADDPQRRVTLSHLMGDHLIVMHSAVRALPGYNRHDAPAMFMDGPSITRETEHGPRRDRPADAPARHAQRGAARRRSTRSARRTSRRASAARRARPARTTSTTGWASTRSASSTFTRPLPPSLEPLPDAMYKALEDLVELVVDGEYEDLSALSGDAELEPEELRRRVEDDCPEALVLPPRSHYVVEAIAKSDEPGDPGFAFFLDLWTDDGPGPAAPRGRAAPDGRPLQRDAQRHPAVAFDQPATAVRGAGATASWRRQMSRTRLGGSPRVGQRDQLRHRSISVARTDGVPRTAAGREPGPSQLAAARRGGQPVPLPHLPAFPGPATAR